eukprot:CAMPEP_0176468554 /NCGR_PEP_ID=MMETSP0127-20121128/39170_1 /TAXON_ID=938130 /ORGANISM="Platyophrya macrostoma, Strain WH" /LENGTH=65 /DNA_ID=CAMNT_0017862161 /DNA_START=60 /DNA_END=254 /DNA_ORIENTATION=-
MHVASTPPCRAANEGSAHPSQCYRRHETAVCDGREAWIQAIPPIHPIGQTGEDHEARRWLPPLDG